MKSTSITTIVGLAIASLVGTQAPISRHKGRAVRAPRIPVKGYGERCCNDSVERPISN